jgi:hypothetical protein
VGEDIFGVVSHMARTYFEDYDHNISGGYPIAISILYNQHLTEQIKGSEIRIPICLGHDTPGKILQYCYRHDSRSRM